MFKFARTAILLALLLAAAAPARAEEVPVEAKIGQMIMIGFSGTEGNQLLFDQISSGAVGGVLLLPYNIVDRPQLGDLVGKIKEIKTSLPLFIALDQEGGEVSRLNRKKGFADFPSAKSVAASYSIDQAFDLYIKMAKMEKEAGANLNFAPVVDLDADPLSPAIGAQGRSFSPSPRKVVDYALAFIMAHKGEKVLTAIKHYPGHGSAREDSHVKLADITKTWQTQEEVPFSAIIKRGMADMVMTAHVMNADIDDAYPASLSQKHIQGNLRGRLGYKGVVVTDDLQMGAVSARFPLEETVVQAVNSGSDILLFANFYNPDPDIPEKVKEIVLQALGDGRIKEERINEAYNRIVKLKKKIKP
jgi:beta-N-acetylhexosaminidase